MYDEHWPKKVVKSKLIAHFQLELNVFLPIDILHQCPTPTEFIEYAKYTDAVLKLQESDENDFFLENTGGKIIKKKKTAYRYYFNFILNFIASDIYYYKLERKHSEKGDSSESDENESEEKETQLFAY
jgi:hypothetical protein